MNKLLGIIIQRIKDGKFQKKKKMITNKLLNINKKYLNLKYNISLFLYISLFFYNSYEIKYSPTKYIETTERGLVVVSVNEADGGRYDCHLGGSLLCSYNITVDAHR